VTNQHNTLYVTQERAWIGLEGEAVRVTVGDAEQMRVPLHHLSSVVCWSGVRMSGEAMAACAERGVAVVWLGWSGRFLARVEGAMSNTATLRRAQYRAADDEARTLALARAFVAGKLANARSLLRRAARTRDEDVATLDAAADRLAVLAKTCVDARDLDQLRGVEGDGAARYFGAFDAMLGPGVLRFEKRSRRPPENEINALLSFGYALLSTDCVAALNAAGLDPAVGYLHPERSGRPALALDLMEELRPIMVDRMVLAMVRRAQVDASGFERLTTGEVRMTAATRKAVIVEYQQRKREEVTHPETGQQGNWGVMIHVQARMLARAIRGEAEYVPYFLR
jgi:CRISPR-associated protein Cas1